MIYNIYNEKMRAPEVTTLKLVSNKGVANPDVSVVVVDSVGNVRPGGYICTFQQNGSLFLVAQLGQGFGFRTDSFRRIVCC